MDIAMHTTRITSYSGWLYSFKSTMSFEQLDESFQSGFTFNLSLCFMLSQWLIVIILLIPLYFSLFSVCETTSYTWTWHDLAARWKVGSRIIRRKWLASFHRGIWKWMLVLISEWECACYFFSQWKTTFIVNSVTLPACSSYWYRNAMFQNLK